MNPRSSAGMAWLFRVYARLIRAELAVTFEYRVRMIVRIITFVFPLVTMAAWLAVVTEEGSTASWGPAEIVSYYLVATLVYQLTSAWIVWSWDEEVRLGTLSMKLLRPLDPIHHALAQLLANKVFLLVVMTPMLAVAELIARVELRGVSAAMIGAAAGSIIVGFALNFLMNMTFAMLSFWTTRAMPLFAAWSGVGQILSGFVAPIPMMPAGLGRIASLLPFWGTLGLPVEIATGKLGWQEIGTGMAASVAWTALFLALYRLLWRAGLKRYEAVGG